MRVQAKSPGKKIALKERVSTLKLTAENAGDALELAELLKIIQDGGVATILKALPSRKGKGGAA